MSSPLGTKGYFPPPLQECPNCGSPELEAVSDGELTNFFCTSCATCWHVELGYVHQVDVTTCPGCDHRPTCLLREALERSESGWLPGEV